jgi:nickel/cobalt transporter (NiCoT) family protein
MSLTTHDQTSRPARTLDRRRLGGLLAVIALLHLLAWGILVLLVLPGHYAVGTQVFGLGLAVTAYTLGMRHAFDADHIAAIDNTTRKLIADGRRPVSVGFWFALGHSTVVVVLALLIAGGSHLVSAVSSEDSALHQILGTVSTCISGLFLYLIALLNLIALIGIVRVWRSARRDGIDERALEDKLNSRGLFNRYLGRLTQAVSHPGQMYPIGLLFGLGFDTATEVLLLVLAGNSAAAGLPWYAILVLPLLFSAGMALLDTLDGAFMNVAYDWAFARPVRKIFYNLTITGLSVAVAALIGSIELVGVLHDQLGLTDPLTEWISNLDLNNVGFLIVGVFVLVWVAALAYWRLARVEDRWTNEVVNTENSQTPGTEALS